MRTNMYKLLYLRVNIKTSLAGKIYKKQNINSFWQITLDGNEIGCLQG